MHHVPKTQNTNEQKSGDNPQLNSNIQFKMNRPEHKNLIHTQLKADESRASLQLQSIQNKANNFSKSKSVPSTNFVIQKKQDTIQLEGGPKKDPDKDDGPTEEEMDAEYARFLADPTLGTSYYEVDPDAGESHARERHTKEGIWRANAVLTAHTTKVAIFNSDAEFEAALRNMPTVTTEWNAGAGGRYDAQIGDIHYQGTLLGHQMSLFSVYPTDKDRQYRKAGVIRLLGAPNLRTFCDGLPAEKIP